MLVATTFPVLLRTRPKVSDSTDVVPLGNTLVLVVFFEKYHCSRTASTSSSLT